MLRPRALKPGDTIRFVSPSSPVDPEKLPTAVSLLESWGFRVELSENALATGAFLAGSDEVRAADLTSAFLDPSVHAVFCTRGGCGSARLFSRLDYPKLAATGKLFCGFSDITTLHLGLNAAGLATAHAPMALSLHFPREAWVYESLRQVLTGEKNLPQGAPRGETVTAGKAKGIVTGGCLTLIADAMGTPYAMHAANKIVLIEDVDVPPHRIDQMLTQFRNAGLFEGCAGIVVGEMTRSESKIDETIGGADWREIIRERLVPLGLPMIMDYPFGHAKNMLTLPLGIEAELDAEAGTLSYTDPLCI